MSADARGGGARTLPVERGGRRSRLPAQWPDDRVRRPDGRTAAKATRNLYTVRTNGTGLKRLTSNGG